LSEQPLTASLLSQSFWILLLLQPACRAAWRQDCDTLPVSHTVDGGCSSGGRSHRMPREWITGWAVALPLSAMVPAMHVMWYSSFSRTNVATSTLLWNTDIVTTPLLAAMVARRLPTCNALLGGLIGLLGAGFAIGANEARNTLLGCGLCFSASLLWAFIAVLVEEAQRLELITVIRLLALEGVVAAFALSGTASITAISSPEVFADWLACLPPVPWIVFMGVNSLFLNVGWLTCTELAGSAWTAMVACLTIPLTMVLDFLFVGKLPTLLAAMGGVMVFSGFLIVECWAGASPQALPGKSGTSAHSVNQCCCHWRGQLPACAKPLLADTPSGGAD